MLATLSSRCSSKRHFDLWRSRDQWLQQQLSLCPFPYVRLVNFRISRARQTMDEGGPDNRDKNLAPGNFNISMRRQSCPLRPALRLFDEPPEQIIRPASACGFYEDPEVPQSPTQDDDDTEPLEFDEASGANCRRAKSFTSSSRHLFSSVQRSMRRLSKNSLIEEPPRNTEPKLPSVMKHYSRGVSPDNTEQIGASIVAASPENSSETTLYEAGV